MSRRGLPTLDEKLDEALKGTFPASDPFALFPEVRRRTTDRLRPVSANHGRPVRRNQKFAGGA
jgi:hypothetical protein